jgi:uncharacterized 2Fe-2S/4Fe-4S cluster protein (DUF4445 family)
MSALERRLLEKKGLDPERFRLACQCEAMGEVIVKLPETQAFALADLPAALPEHDGSKDAPLGFAIDIGTTTIALALMDMPSQVALSVKSALNPQGVFGADVLSRISYSNENGPHELKALIRDKLGELMSSALKEANASEKLVSRICATGNTTMLYYLMGLDPREIGQAPFEAKRLFGETLEAGSVFPQLKNSELYIPDCISAYVGADITCGIAYLEHLYPGEPKLLADAGTNGEMALMGGDRIWCCATAAGPAFEGTHISQGMIAADGAIYGVKAKDGEIEVKTIGSLPPIGICGTGLISAARLALETGALEESGYMEEESFSLGNSGIAISSQDIRQLQMAKSAIASGIEILLEESKLSAPALYLAGGFGHSLDPKDAAFIGLIPESLAGVSHAAGNTALHGALLALVSEKSRIKFREAAKKACVVQLSNNPKFTELYMERMAFSAF